MQSSPWSPPLSSQSSQIHDSMSVEEPPPPLQSMDSMAMDSGRRYRMATEIVHVSTASDRPGEHYNASSMPIYQTATFKQESATQMGEFDYSRSGNPTRAHLGQSGVT
jgi:cystathionine beta-lyase